MRIISALVKTSITCLLLAAAIRPTDAATKLIGPNSYVSYIPTAKIQLDQTTQVAPEWCWAASISTVLNYYGCHTNQQEIVTHVFGGPVDMAGQPADIYNALHTTAVIGGTTRVILSQQVMNNAQLIGFLDHEAPVLLAYQHPQGGHMVLCTAVYYSLIPGGVKITGLTVRDPWPYSAPKQNWNMGLNPAPMVQFPPTNPYPPPTIPYPPSEITIPPPGVIQFMVAVWF